MKFSKVASLPSTLVADHLYIVSSGATAKLYITDKLGLEARPLGVDPVTSFPRYDLSTATTTGEIDLAVTQVVSITNNVAGTTNVTTKNAPSGKAMTAVVQVVGDVGAIAFPGATLAEGVTLTVTGSPKTLFVLFIIGGTVTVTSVIRTTA